MSQEEKELLLKDISARLPYGVKIDVPDLFFSTKKNIEVLKEIFCGDDGEFRCNDSGMLIKYVKPYLFPLSSMTEEQKNDLTKNLHSNVFVKDEISFWCLFTANMMGEWKKVFEWCVKNHFDICGLIPKGLAIDATNKNIY